MYSTNSSSFRHLSRSMSVRALFALTAFIFCLTSVQTVPAQKRKASGKTASVVLGVGPITFTVTNTADSGAGSLRQAVLNSNGSIGGTDTIVFDASFATAQTIVLTSGELAITDTLNVTGPGANLLTVSGNNNSRIFHSNFATVAISGMTLTAGNGAGASLSGTGGAILVSNIAVTLSGVNVTGNTSTGGHGGGVFFDGGTHVISNSTISANDSGTGEGGGFYNQGATLSVTNSTISGNTANSQGGGFYNDGVAVTTLRSVTITLNTEPNNGGGGIFNSGTLDLGNTIVAGNTSANEDDIWNAGGSLTTSGYNLIGSNESITSQFPDGNPNVNNDIVGTGGAQIDPQLSALGANGGTTPTHAFSAVTSPAVDQGLSFGLTTDQRGSTRPIDRGGTVNAAGGDGADIGAFELQAPSNAGVPVSGRVVTAEGRGLGRVRLTLTGSNGVLRQATSSPFGFYRFEDIPAGDIYLISASSKVYRFASQSINLFDELANVDFVAQ